MAFVSKYDCSTLVSRCDVEMCKCFKPNWSHLNCQYAATHHHQATFSTIKTFTFSFLLAVCVCVWVWFSFRVTECNFHDCTVCILAAAREAIVVSVFESEGLCVRSAVIVNWHFCTFVPVQCIGWYDMRQIATMNTEHPSIVRILNEIVVTYKRTDFLCESPACKTNFITSIKSQIIGTRNENIQIHVHYIYRTTVDVDSKVYLPIEETEC